MPDFQNKIENQLKIYIYKKFTNNRILTEAQQQNKIIALCKVLTYKGN